ncbi:MAG: hypothetical protein K2X43_06035 [Hyphomonadaceae bacterium]|nr:hypothetical protein [Hyphomonadaceae bacterium]
MTQPASSIELWLVDLETCAKTLDLLERDTQRLTAEDRAYADRIGQPRERRQRLTAYAALRLLLERVAGPGVRGCRLVRPAGGKPRLDGGGVEFSLSHIDGLALIGVSRAGPLGVDLERMRPARLAPHRLEEISAIGAGLGDQPLPALGAEQTFLQAWARLEAFAKARGRGVARTLTDVGVRGRGLRRLSPADTEAGARQLAHAAGITVHDLTLPSGLYGAVGAARGARPGHARPFPAEAAGVLRLLARPGPTGGLAPAS